MQGPAETCSKVPFCRRECQGRLKVLLNGPRTQLDPCQALPEGGARWQTDKHHISPMFVRDSTQAKEGCAEAVCHVFLDLQDEQHFLATGPGPKNSL